MLTNFEHFLETSILRVSKCLKALAFFSGLISFFHSKLGIISSTFRKSTAEKARPGRPEMGLPRERHRVPYPTAKGDILELQICILALESLFTSIL